MTARPATNNAFGTRGHLGAMPRWRAAKPAATLSSRAYDSQSIHCQTGGSVGSRWLWTACRHGVGNECGNINLRRFIFFLKKGLEWVGIDWKALESIGICFEKTFGIVWNDLWNRRCNGLACPCGQRLTLVRQWAAAVFGKQGPAAALGLQPTHRSSPPPRPQTPDARPHPLRQASRRVPHSTLRISSSCSLH